MTSEDRVDVQEWWWAPTATSRCDHRLRDGHRQGGRALRVPRQPAKGLESYSQEIGRAGRDGAPSICELFACADDIPTLENFAYGDDAVRARRSPGSSTRVFAHDRGEQFAVAEHDLSSRHDVRPLVLKTVLTYLELDGFLQQGTPFYAGYSMRPLTGSLDDVFASFDVPRCVPRARRRNREDRPHLDEHRPRGRGGRARGGTDASSPHSATSSSKGSSS
jgi:Superfamily II DNA helicase